MAENISFQLNLFPAYQNSAGFKGYQHKVKQNSVDIFKTIDQIVPGFYSRDPEDQSVFLDKFCLREYLRTKEQLGEILEESYCMNGGDNIVSSDYINNVPLNNFTIKSNYGVSVEFFRRGKGGVNSIEYNKTLTPKKGRYDGVKLKVTKVDGGYMLSKV